MPLPDCVGRQVDTYVGFLMNQSQGNAGKMTDAVLSDAEEGKTGKMNDVILSEVEGRPRPALPEEQPDGHN